MRLQFLGTGTSSGVPAIACDCSVCTSEDPKNKRRRCSIRVSTEDAEIVVDTPPDFREQALAYDVRRVDAVLITHTHADHIFGMDDLRRYGFVQDAVIPVYGSSETVDELRRFFYYTSSMPGERRALPRLKFTPLPEGLEIGSTRVQPIEVPHGPGVCTGYLLRNQGRSIGYFPDCSSMPENTIRALQGLDVMILDALRRKPSPSHLTLEASVAALKAIGAQRSFLTHLSHDLDHEETAAELPRGIEVAYDGLEVQL